MGRHDALTRSLAIVGTLLVALPMLAPVVFGLVSLVAQGAFRIDYLMPFEVYFVTLAGIALVVFAAFRAHAHKGLVGICVGIMLGGIVLGGVAAKVTGIADSVETLETWRYVVTAAFGVISLLGQAGLVVAGSMLVRDAFSHHEDTPPMQIAPGA